MLLREKFWMWGHPEGRFNLNADGYGCNEVSRMTPMEGCLYLGIRNTFMVPCGVSVNRRQYNKSFKTLKSVGWDCFGAWENPELIETNIAEAAEFENIGCVVMDDFKRKTADGGFKYRDYDINVLKNIFERLHNNEVRRLDSWMVLYTHEFGEDNSEDEIFKPYLDMFDGITMWNWRESEYKNIPQKFETLKKLTPNNRFMFGCYLYNFGERCQATAEAVKWQLDFYREKLYAKEAEGVVLHTNTMADLDYEAYDAACEWMDKHGDENID